jgi:hypothetical protein
MPHLGGIPAEKVLVDKGRVRCTLCGTMGVMSFSLGSQAFEPGHPAPTVSDPSPASPPASRVGARRLRDPRLWVGVLLVAGSAMVGGRVLAAADDTVELWSAAHDIPAGAEIAVDDLVVTSVHFADADAAKAYLLAGSSLTGSRLAQSLSAGQLIPSSAVEAAAEPAPELPLGVAAADLPADLAPGDRVDVWALPAERDAGGVTLVMRDVRVVAVSAPSVAAAGGDREVLVAVGNADVESALVDLAGARPVLVRVDG